MSTCAQTEHQRRVSLTCSLFPDRLSGFSELTGRVHNTTVVSSFDCFSENVRTGRLFSACPTFSKVCWCLKKRTARVEVLLSGGHSWPLFLRHFHEAGSFFSCWWLRLCSACTHGRVGSSSSAFDQLLVKARCQFRVRLQQYLVRHLSCAEVNQLGWVQVRM